MAPSALFSARRALGRRPLGEVFSPLTTAPRLPKLPAVVEDKDAEDRNSLRSGSARSLDSGRSFSSARSRSSRSGSARSLDRSGSRLGDGSQGVRRNSLPDTSYDWSTLHTEVFSIVVDMGCPNLTILHATEEWKEKSGNQLMPLRQQLGPRMFNEFKDWIAARKREVVPQSPREVMGAGKRLRRFVFRVSEVPDPSVPGRRQKVAMAVDFLAPQELERFTVVHGVSPITVCITVMTKELVQDAARNRGLVREHFDSRLSSITELSREVSVSECGTGSIPTLEHVRQMSSIDISDLSALDQEFNNDEEVFDSVVEAVVSHMNSREDALLEVPCWVKAAMLMNRRSPLGGILVSI